MSDDAKLRRRAPGGGRKPIYDAPLIRCMIRLPQEAIEDLRTLGSGNIAAGVRRLWEQWRNT